MPTPAQTLVPTPAAHGGVDIDPDAGVPFPEDAGYLAMDFDARGHTVFARGSRTTTDVLAVGEPGPTSPVQPATTYTLPLPVTKPLTRVDDFLCLPDIFSGANNGCWLAPASQSRPLLRGGDRRGGDVPPARAPRRTSGSPIRGAAAGAHGAPRTYLSPNDAPNCGPAWSLLAPGDFLALQPRTSTPSAPASRRP